MVLPSWRERETVQSVDACSRVGRVDVAAAAVRWSRRINEVGKLIHKACCASRASGIFIASIFSGGDSSIDDLILYSGFTDFN